MGVTIRPLTERDLPAADRLIRLAFGTFLGAPEPEQFWADPDYARTRWHADPTAAFGAEIEGTLVGVILPHGQSILMQLAAIAQV